MYYRVERPEDHGHLDRLNVVLDDLVLPLAKGGSAEIEFDFTTKRGARQFVDLERQGYRIVEIAAKTAETEAAATETEATEGKRGRRKVEPSDTPSGDSAT